MALAVGNLPQISNNTRKNQLNFEYLLLRPFIWSRVLFYLSQDWRENKLGKLNSESVKFLNKIEGGMFALNMKRYPYYKPCDAFVAGVFLRPEMITDEVTFHADIELHGNRTRGQVVLDHLQFNKPNVFLIRDVNCEIFQNLLLDICNF